MKYMYNCTYYVLYITIENLIYCISQLMPTIQALLSLVTDDHVVFLSAVLHCLLPLDRLRGFTHFYFDCPVSHSVNL